MTEFDQVKDSGERRDFGTGSVRDVRTGKGRYDLLEPYAIKRLAQHFENGAAKYGDNNWKLGQPLSGYLDSGIRHCFNLLAGETDEDHAAAAAWNLMAFISTKHWVDEGTLPGELDDIDWVYDIDEDEPTGVGRPPFVPLTRQELIDLLPEFEKNTSVSLGPDLHYDYEDGQIKTTETLVSQFVNELRTVAEDEPVVIMSGDVASLFQELVEAGRGDGPTPHAVYAKLTDLLAAIDDVDNDKQNSVESDRPTSTDQSGGNNVR